MKITGVKVVLHDRQTSSLDVFGAPDGKLPMGVLSIETDEGVEGNNFLSLPGPGPAAVAEQIATFLKPLLIGQNPLDIGRHWARMSKQSWFVDPIAIGVVDVALWDIAGKVAGLPVHRLLGTCRDSVPAYFSSGRHDSPEAYAEEALYWREQGWKGYKLHPPTSPWRMDPSIPVKADIDACAAVLEATGGEMTLMLDSAWGYSYSEALEVGQAIQQMGYCWYEDPLSPEDIHGYKRLKQHLSIPILATEVTRGGLYALPQWITEGATDFLRGDVVIKGGITGMMKIAHLAESFHMGCEVHDAYNAMNNVASLHVIMAIPNCEWFEVIAFNKAGYYGLEHLSYGLAEPIAIDRDGLVHAPSGPGLGYEIDWDLINSARTGEIG